MPAFAFSEQTLFPEFGYNEAKWQESRQGAGTLLCVDKPCCWLRRRLAQDSWQQGIIRVRAASEQKKVCISTNLLKRGGALLGPWLWRTEKGKQIDRTIEQNPGEESRAM